MKKIFFLLSMITALIFCGVSVNAEIYIEDKAGLYNEEQESYVYSRLQEAANTTGWNFGVYTTNEFDYDPERYGEDEAYTMAGRKAEEIYDSVFGRDSSGLLFFCDVGYRYTVVAGDARKYIVGKRFDNMNSAMRREYNAYDDTGVVDAMVDSVITYYEKGEGSSDIRPSTVIIAALIALVITAIVIAIVTSSYHNLAKPDTKRYMVQDKTNIYNRSSVIVSTRHYSYSNSSSSGSGHSGGGGFSGGHHGGGGFGGHR